MEGFIISVHVYAFSLSRPVTQEQEV